MKKTSLFFSWALFASLSVVSNVSYSAPPANTNPKPKYGPIETPRATPLSLASEYFRSPSHPAPDFWHLIPYYVGQYNERSCSVAALTMVLNAARVGQKLTADDKLVLQEPLLEKVSAHNWKKRMSDEGDRGKHGATLDQLGDIAKEAFQGLGFKMVRVEVVHIDEKTPTLRKKLHMDLLENERNPNDYIITNFLQSTFTDDADAGHFAPIGAYDAKAKKVLILDPDRQWYEPYWVSEETLLRGMNTKDSETTKMRGYLHIWVK